MAIALDEPVRAQPGWHPSGKLILTAADLARFPKSLSSGDVKWELHNGELVPMSPPGFTHSKVALKIGAELLYQGEYQGYGEAGDESGVILRRNPDHVVGADAVFVAKRSLPAKLSPERYLETIPDIVVEVRSKNDSRPEVETKVADYLSAGVVVVWVADENTRTVTAYRKDQPPHVFTAADELTVPDVIPSFRVPVSRLFPE